MKHTLFPFGSKSGRNVENVWMITEQHKSKEVRENILKAIDMVCGKNNSMCVGEVWGRKIDK